MSPLRKTTTYVIFFYLFTALLSSCKSETQSDLYESEDSDIETTDQNNDEEKCKFEDGTYDATVDYYNPSTNYSTTYTLDVDVQDCEVVQINFPNGGYLDYDHINPEELDENGYASVSGEEGKTYEVQINQ